jgi:acyl transferase domain-containing protein
VPPPVEAYVLHARDAASLAATASRIAELAPSLSDAELRDLACQLGRDGCPPGGFRAGIVAGGQEQLAALAREAARLARSLRPGQLAARPGIVASSGARGRVALLFPGLAIGQDWAGESAGCAPGCASGCAPPPLFGLTDPQAVQPAILHASLSGLRWLDKLGVTATTAVGHSMGEITGLVWAGCLTETEATRLVAQRSAVISASGARQTAMVSVGADAAAAAALCQGTDLVIAAYNGPGWHVLAGSVPGVREATRRAERQGIRALVLDVSHAFHSPAMASCVAPLRSVLADIRFGRPQRRLLSTVTGREISAGDDVPALLCMALTSPVRFADALAEAAGEADLLCETGPGHALAALAAAGCDVPAVSLEARTADDRGPARAAAALFAAGAVNSLEPILAGREARPVDIWQERIVVSAGVRPARGEPAETGNRPVTVASIAAANGTRAGSANGAARPSPDTPAAADPAEAEAGAAEAEAGAAEAEAGAAEAEAGVAEAEAAAAAAEIIPIGHGTGRAERSAQSAGQADAAAERNEPAQPSLQGRFLEKVRLYRPGEELVAESRLDPASDPYLEDYQIDGLTALPAVMGLEAMAQAASALAGRPMLHATQVSFGEPVVVRPGTLIRVCGEREGKRVITVLRSRDDGQWTDHCRAVFQPPAAQEQPGRPTAAGGGTAAGFPSWTAAEPATAIVDSNELYGPVCFQAGRFRRVAFLPELTSRRCRALVRGGDDQPWFGARPGSADVPLLLGSPGLNDATVHVLQACFPRRRVLPAGCDSVTVSGHQVRGAVEVTAMQRSAARTAARRPALVPVPEAGAGELAPGGSARSAGAGPGEPHSSDEHVWDVTAVDGTGRVIVSWTGLRLRDAGPLPGNPALPPALLGVYLERGATTLGLDPALRINVRCEPPLLGPAAARSLSSAVAASPSRRPGWVSARSCGQLDELSLRLRAASPAACAWQTADPEDDDPGLARDIDDPEFASLRQRLGESLAEPLPTVHARIRTAIECLSKAGRPVGCELVVDGCYDDGWALLHAGEALIACASVRVLGISSPVAVSVMSGTGVRAAGAA